MAHDGEEIGTVETLTMEQVLTALLPEGVAVSFYAPHVACGHVRRALLDPENLAAPPGEVADESPQGQGLGSKGGVGKSGGAPLENWPHGAHCG